MKVFVELFSEFIGMFDQDFMRMLVLNTIGITLFLNYFYDYSLWVAVSLSLGLYLSFFFGIIVIANILTQLFRLFDKGPKVYK